MAEFETENTESLNEADENQELSHETSEESEGAETDQTSDDGDNSDDDDEQTSDDADESEKDSDSEETEETPEQKQAKIDHAFSKKKKQLRDAKLEREAAIKRAEDAEKRLAELTAPKAPEVPELPDSWDPEYETKLAERDAALLEKKKYDERIEQQEKEKADASQQLINQRMEEVQKKQESYQERAEAIGLDKAELQKHEDNLVKYIEVNPNVAPVFEFILGDENGPLIVKLLDEDPEEFETLVSMSPMDAGAYIKGGLTQKALKFKPKTTKTPAPIKTYEKRGSTKSDSPYLKGATFE